MPGILGATRYPSQTTWNKRQRVYHHWKHPRGVLEDTRYNVSQHSRQTLRSVVWRRLQTPLPINYLRLGRFALSFAISRWRRTHNEPPNGPGCGITSVLCLFLEFLCSQAHVLERGHRQESVEMCATCLSPQSSRLQNNTVACVYLRYGNHRLPAPVATRRKTGQRLSDTYYAVRMQLCRQPAAILVPGRQADTFVFGKRRT